MLKMKKNMQNEIFLLLFVNKKTNFAKSNSKQIEY